MSNEAAKALQAERDKALEALKRLSAQCEATRLSGWKETDAERTAKAVIAELEGGA
jgi:hypothetical protein